MEYLARVRGTSRSERWFRSLVQNSSDVVMILEAEGTVRYVSSAIERVLGYRPEEMVGSLALDYVHPEDVEHMRESLARTLKEPGVHPPVEYRVRTADGSWRYMEAIRSNRLDDPHIAGVVANVRDITERKKAEEALRRSESSLATAQRIAHLGNWDYDVTNDEAWWSDEMYRIFGFAPRRFVPRYRTFLNSVHPDDRDLIRRSVRRALYEEKHGVVEYRVVRPDGEVRVVQSHYEVTRDVSNRAVKLVGTVHDTTERKEAEKEKGRQARQAALRADVSAALAEGGTLPRILHRCTECMVHHLDSAFARIWTLDEEGKTLELQASAGMYTHLDGPHSRVPVGKYKIGLIAEERLPHLTNDVVNDPRVSDKEWAEREGMVAFAGHPLVVEGRVVGVMAMFAREPLEEDTIEALGSVADVIAQGIERKRAEERLRHQAFHDPLTGLPNRHLFSERLKQALRHIRWKKGRRAAVLFMDLDNFKAVNDSFGHEIGDRLLVAVAERLKGCLRLEDTLSRFGGDEFTVLLEDVENPKEAVRVAERIVEGLKVPCVVDGREFFVRTSIGISLGTSRTKSSEDLLRDADTAMYRAKEAGVDYRVFNPPMHERVLGRLGLENDLWRALEREEFRLFYQPKIRLKEEDTVDEVEALVRWQHPQRGLVTPDEFIPLAEETGLIVPIGRWVLREACRQAKEWQDRYPKTPPLVVCVNVAAGQLRYPDLLDDVASALRESGIEGRSLGLEVTESALVKDMEMTMTVLKELRKEGIRFSLDDFGSEYSSLSYLMRLPVDFVKIDKSFVWGLGEDPRAAVIVEAIISLAHSLGLEAVGEGVESAEQLESLRSMGCDLVQGYHLARPLPPEDVPEFLAE